MNFVELCDACEFLDNKRRPVKESERKPGPFPYYGANGQQGWIDGYIFDEPLVLIAEDGGHFGSKVNPIAYKIQGKTWVNNHAHVLRPLSVCDIDYLKHVLSFYDVTKLITGTTRPKLTKGDAEQIRIPFPELREQKVIAQKLDQADRLRRLRRYALETSESFLKATFIKLFGDPYTSKRSDVACLQDIAIINPAIKPTLDDREELSFVPMSDVDEKNGEIVGVQIRKYGDVKKGYTAFENGDVLFAKITPCMENGKSAIAKNLRNGIGFGSTEWHVLRPTPRTNSEWLLGLVRLDSVRQNAARRFVGSAGQQRVPEDFLMQLMVSVPSSADLERYKGICNRHEALIHTNQEALRQAEHLFQSLLHQAFSEDYCNETITN